MRGRFITFEGGEGAGKTTQLRLLVEALGARGVTAVATREPGGSAGAEDIRRLLVEGGTGRWDGLTELLLHCAARRDHLLRTVLPALEAGKWVVSDRFADSSMAYQGYGHGVGRAAVEALHEIAIGDFRPDLTLVLDLPVEAGLARAASRGGAEDRYERMGVAFHERLRQGFLDIAAREPGRCAVIDAARGPEAVHRAVIAAVTERLGL
ncbi:dTMP kinase [Arenibaculum pallidiluteum]|uniref:dTMP kinase n=1 Tax=Arenibaculum pallidiluteum TaxID=2812559 RepID=UPI001A956794|nr:dTMP kinase [Arenibaculum pallidiluteum]